MAVNQRWLVTKHPIGLPTIDTWKLETVATPTAADVPEGGLLLRAIWQSVDPYLRGRLAEWPINTPLVSGQVAEVVVSKNNAFKEGDTVEGLFPWQRLHVHDGKSGGIRKVDKTVPLSAYLGILGMPGRTAWYGLQLLEPKKGETLVVSGAAGAVGTAVGQLAKLAGLRVIGSAGGPEKAKHLLEKYGFDGAIDYKAHDTAEKVAAELKRLAPNGIDCYFDNTGGAVSEAIYPLLNKWARVAICGQIAYYNKTHDLPKVPVFLHNLIYKSVRIQGFVVYDMKPEHYAQYDAEVPPLVKNGKLKYEETVVEGFEKLPESELALFHGANVGKLVVKIA